MISRRTLGIAILFLAALGAVAQTNVTTSGGTANTLPVFTGSSTVGNSQISVWGFTGSVTNTNTDNSIVFTFGQNTGYSGFVRVVFNIYSGYLGVDGSRQSAVVEVAYAQNTSNTVFISPLNYSVYGNGSLNLNAGYSTGTNSFSVDFTNSTVGGGSMIVEATVELQTDQLSIPSPALGTTAAGAFTSIPNRYSSNAGVSLNSGNVGIGTGTTTPTSLLSVGSSSQFTVNSSGAVNVPSLTFTGATGTQTTPWTGVLCGGDYAEAVDAAGDLKSYAPGDVLVISDDAGDDVRKSSEPYSTMVAGIYATKPGVVGRRESLPKDAQDLPMAMVGIVPTKVTAENGPIHRGDLLVTSSTPGYAMKGTDRNRLVGAVIGKAMGTLDHGEGVIEVLVTLQ